MPAGFYPGVVKRWLVVAAALVLAAAALLVLVRRQPPPGGPPMDRIDDASRQRLEQVLRDEERR
jgi:hypothetical protein